MIGIAIVVCLFNYFTLLIRLKDESTTLTSTLSITTEDFDVTTSGTLVLLPSRKEGIVHVKEGPTNKRDSLMVESTYNTTVQSVGMTAAMNAATKAARRSTTSPQINDFQQQVWQSLQNESKIGIHIFQPEDAPPPKTLILIGERHSGTTFLTSHLKECFPHMKVDDTFVNGKHWWQPTPNYVVEVTSRISDREKMMYRNSNYDLVSSLWTKIAARSDQQHGNNDDHNKPNEYFQSTVVIAVFRNPYDW